MDVSSKKPWKCNFRNCYQAFKSEERLKKHKASDSSHDYCHYCDEGFEDWDALTAHKTAKAADEIRDVKKWETRELHREMMEVNGVRLHIIERQREQDPKPKLRHMCCKFCGMDFGSLAGRDAHLKQQHQVDQEIPCPGCDLVFHRASALIRHFEQNECPRITENRFAGYMQHKAIVRKLLANPELINELGMNDVRGTVVDTDEESRAMLNILDYPDDGSDLGPTLKPERSNTHRQIHLSQLAWPELPTSKTRSASVEAIDGIRNLSISCGVSPYSKPIKVETETLPHLEDLPAFIEPTASTSTPQPSRTGGSAWIKPLPNAQPSSAQAVANSQSVTDSNMDRDYRHNILQYQFWNPTHRDYNAERFYHPMLEEYRCPIPGCDTGAKTASELEAHITATHKQTRKRCPGCFREFKTQAALVAHCEAVVGGVSTGATGRCRLRYADALGVCVDELSGGFLNARRVARPDSDVAVDGSRIRYVRFESGVPEDLRVEMEAERGTTMVTGGADMRGTLGARIGEMEDDRSEDEVEADARARVEIDWF